MPEVQQTIETLEDRQYKKFLDGIELYYKNLKFDRKLWSIQFSNSVYNGETKIDKDSKIIAHGVGHL